MLCYEIYINGDVIARAGIDSIGTLTAILSYVIENPEHQRILGRSSSAPQAQLNVSGYARGEHLLWVGGQTGRCAIKPGDEVMIRVIESDTIDTPGRSFKAKDSTSVRRSRYEFYQLLKREFELEADTIPLEELDSKEAIRLRRNLFEQLKLELGEV